MTEEEMEEVAEKIVKDADLGAFVLGKLWGALAEKERRMKEEIVEAMKAAAGGDHGDGAAKP